MAIRRGGETIPCTSHGVQRECVRRLLVLLVGLALLLAMITLDRATTRDGDTVAAIGDSIMLWGEPEMRTTVGAYTRLTVRAQGGKRIDEMMPAARELAAGSPIQVIINLGTNNVLQRIPLEQSTAELTEMVGLFPTAECIHLVTINENIDKDGFQPRDAAVALNTAMEKIAKDNPRVSLIRWDEMVRKSIQREPPTGFIFDGVHPGPEGQRALAGAYDRAVDRCGRPWKFW